MEDCMDTQLKTFLCVCETLNFTRAAQQLFLWRNATASLFSAAGAGHWY